jgi:hypothetical protein
LGKVAWVYEFEDASELYGLNDKAVKTGTRPADFICTLSGWMGLVECKATKDKTGFKLGGIRKPQWIAAIRCVASGSPYIFAIRNENDGSVYLVPARVIVESKGTIAWAELVSYLWPEGVNPYAQLH